MLTLVAHQLFGPKLIDPALLLISFSSSSNADLAADAIPCSISDPSPLNNPPNRPPPPPSPGIRLNGFGMGMGMPKCSAVRASLPSFCWRADLSRLRER